MRIAMKKKKTPKKRTETTDDRRLSEEKFSKVFLMSPDSIAINKLRDGVFLDINEGFVHLTGYSRDEVIGKSVAELNVWASPDDRRKFVRHLVKHGGLRDFEAEFLMKNGSTRTGLVSGRLMNVHNEEWILTVTRDITERKKAERFLVENEERMRLALEGANIAVFNQDAELRYTWIYNAQFSPYSDQIVGKTDWEILPSPDVEKLILIKQGVLASGKGVHTEVCLSRDGKESFFDLRVEPLKNAKGDVVGITGASLDITNRKKAEEQLKLQKAYFQQLFESAPEAIVLLKSDERIVQVNREFTRLFGYSQEDAVDCEINDLIVPQEYKEEGLTLTRRVAQGSIVSTESVRKRKDGSLVDVSILGRPVRVEGGEIALYAIYRDITDRKAAEDALRKSEFSFRGLFNSVNEAIYIQDREGKFVDVNEGAVKMYGHSREYFVGKDPSDLGAPGRNDLAKVAESFRKAFEGESQQFEFWGVRKNGEVFPKEVRISKGSYFGQEVVIALAQDITERKKTEETIQKLHHAVEQTDEVIIMTEPDGVITYVNPAFEKLYRYSREEVVGKTPRILKSGGMSQEYYAGFWRDLLAGRSIRAEHINKTKDGRIVIVEASVNSIYDTKGKLAGFVAVQEDISDRKRNESERKRLEAQLLQTQKLESVGTLAGGIAHDFNNILGIILAYAAMLKKADLPHQKVSDAADVINRAVERGAELVKQILTFARKTDVVYGLVNINVMIKELKRMLTETFPRTISIATELDATVSDITADAAQVHQAILNICVNARDAMPAGGMLVLRTQTGTRSEVSSYFPEATSERYVRVCISDTGTGMDENTRQRIFEPFFTTKAKGKGTGLGLSVVYGVVKNHNGFVRVDSEIGRGTSFYLYFPAPVQSLQAAEISQGSLLEIPGGTESVLVVEDEEPLLNVLSGLLKSKGYRVYMARDGYEAIETYEEHHNDIAIVVSDLGLPKMTGQDAFLRMKSVNPRVKVIFGTGYLDPELKTELLSLGARGFLSKPYSQDELLKRIRELIDEGE